VGEGRHIGNYTLERLLGEGGMGKNTVCSEGIPFNPTDA